jgi:hypothetical protein
VNLERVRLVEDRGKEKGALLSSDVLTRHRDTLFRLQNALGFRGGRLSGPAQTSDRHQWKAVRAAAAERSACSRPATPRGR